MTEKTDEPLTDERGRNSASPKNAPVSLPAGSYDVDTLKTGLNKAARSAPEKRDETVQGAIKEAIANKALLEPSDGTAQAGYRYVDVKHDELDITERARVFDPKLADDAAQADAEKAKADAAATRTSTAATAGQSKE